MARYIKWIGIFIVTVLSIFVGFTQFGRLAVDYSLESLGYAVEATGKELDDTTLLERHVYRLVVNDLIIEEAVLDVDNFQNMLLLETASRSLQEPVELVGYERARLYIGQVMDNKMSAAASVKDKSRLSIHYFYLYLQNAYLSIFSYAKARLIPNFQHKSSHISNEMLLNQAERSEINGDYTQSRKYYEQYLELYGKKGGKGLVSISLANIMIFQGDWKEAENLLKSIVQEYINQDEGKIARNLLNRIGILKIRKKDIKKYLIDLEKTSDLQEKEDLRFKIALTLLSLRDFEGAKEQFRILINSSNSNATKKATFYLGWVYKLQHQYEEASALFESLLEMDNIDETMMLAIKAELAEISLKTGKLERAKFYYGELADDAQNNRQDNTRESKQWVALSQIEQGIVHIQKGDKKALKDVFKNLQTLGIESSGFEELKVKFNSTKNKDLRAEAFYLLAQSKIDSALDLFKAYLAGHPDDAWAHSGAATCHLILENYDLALEHALVGHGRLADAYTTSLLAYMYSFQGDTQKALELYEIALTLNPKYNPAKYNLAGAYLRINEFDKGYEILKELYSEFKYSSNKKLKSKIINNMGVSYWGNGKEKLAIAAFKEALAINPQFRQASNNLDNVLEGVSPEIASQFELNKQAFQITE